MKKLTKLFGLALLVVISLVVLYYSYIFVRGFLWYYGVIKIPPSLIDPQMAVSNGDYYLVFSTTSFYYPPHVWLSTSKDGVHWSPPKFVYECLGPQLSLDNRGKPLVACSDYYNESIIALSWMNDSRWISVKIMYLKDSLYPFTDSLIKDADGTFWLGLEDQHSAIIYSSPDGANWERDTVIEFPGMGVIFWFGPRFVVNGSDLLLVLQGDPYSWVYRKTESGWIQQMRFNSTVNPYPTPYVKDANGLYWTTYSEDDAIYVKNTRDLAQWGDPIQIANQQIMEKLLTNLSKEE